MATPEAIGIIVQKALERLEANAAAISDKLDVPHVEIPKTNRDRDFLRAKQLEALSLWVESMADSLGVKAEPVVYEDIVAKQIRPADLSIIAAQEQAQNEPVLDDGLNDKTVPELVELAQSRSVDLEGASRKAEIVDRLRAAGPQESLDTKTVKELRELADQENIDLDGATLKADILARIKEAHGANA